MAIDQPLFYKDLLDNLGDGVYFLDRERRLTYWNRGAERITGYTAAEVLGRACADNILAHVDAAGRCLCEGACPAADAMRDGRFHEASVFLRHRNGHRVPVHARIMPIRGEDGTVTGCVEIFSDISQQVALQERLGRLEKLALIDPLTGLANRRFLERSLIALLDASRRYGWVFGVGVADVDDFKRVNDRYGHGIGDEALRMVAENLRGNSRAFDTPGRWGGEEFVIISQNVDGPSHHRIAERYRSLIESSVIPGTGEQGRLTISIGITLARAGDTVAGMVERADGLMYAAKRSGKNRVVQG